MRKLFVSIAITLACLFTLDSVNAQEYKLKQTSSVMGFKSESTIYVKGMRKRTEQGGYTDMMPMGGGPVTIEQCDLQRTVKLNDKKKLYYIEPFTKDIDEVIDEDVKTKVVPAKNETTKPQKGGTITQYYNITDTGERKQMYGFTARHIWTTRKMKPSPDACMMKDSFIIKTDGWYIDLPKFNCPINYRPARPTQAGMPQPECQDKFITRKTGKGKLGFPLVETTTMIMGGTGGQSSEMTTVIETLEFSAAKLDSMLFEIPPGYKEVKTEGELQDKMDINEMIKNYTKENNSGNVPDNVTTETKKAGMIRVGVFAPTGDEQILPAVQQQRMVSTLQGGQVEAIPVSSLEEARTKNCDYTLESAFGRIKSASKLGGLVKAIKNTDPNAASSFNIQANLTLKLLADGSVKAQPVVEGKYEGRVDEAAGKALDEGCRDVLKALK